MRPAGIILAGGLSRRMGGRDKALRQLAGRSILAHVIERLQPQVGALALNANGDPGRFAAFGLPVIPDPVPDYPGPLAGVLAGLMWAAESGVETDLVSVPADAPLLPADLVERLIAARAAAGTDIAVAASGAQRHHVVGLWPLSLIGSLRHALLVEGVHKVSDFVDRLSPAIAGFSDHPFDPFLNINTESELCAAERIMPGLSSPASARPRSTTE